MKKQVNTPKYNVQKTLSDSGNQSESSWPKKTYIYPLKPLIKYKTIIKVHWEEKHVFAQQHMCELVTLLGNYILKEIAVRE